MQLPLSIRNSRKGAFSAGSVVNLPGRIPPLQVRAEEAILRALAGDLNAHYCLGIDQEVFVLRGTCASPNQNQVGRLAIIGSSHMRRMSASDALRSAQIVENLPRWTPTAATVAATKAILTAAKLTDTDCLVLDCFSNSVYTGTNEMGYASPPFQDAAGHYHLEGAVELAPGRSLRVIASMVKELVEVSGAAKVILLLPLPRYVKEGCCTNTAHTTNIGTTGYLDMLSSAGHVVKSIVEEVLGEGGKQPLFFNPLSAFGGENLMETRSSDGRYIWAAGDPVHLSPAAYGDIAAAVIETWQSSEQHQRRRVDSIVEDSSNRRGRRGGLAGGLRGGNLGRGGIRGGGWPPARRDSSGGGQWRTTGGGRGGYNGSGFGGRRYTPY
jgi:hypothetical protein